MHTNYLNQCFIFASLEVSKLFFSFFDKFLKNVTKISLNNIITSIHREKFTIYSIIQSKKNC